jgi:uncharacterized OB-fold protein
MLQGLRCVACGTLAVDTGQSCPACGAREGTAVPLAGRGRLVSWTVIRVAPQRYAAEAPYTIGLVELDEGLRLTARVEGPPEALAAGIGLAVVARDPERGPIFRPS